MEWLKEIKLSFEEAEKARKELQETYAREYARLSPMIMMFLRQIGDEWYGRSLRILKRYRITCEKDFFFWEIKRRGRGFLDLPQKIKIRLRAKETAYVFSIEVSFQDGPSLSATTNDTSQEALKNAILHIVNQT